MHREDSATSEPRVVARERQLDGKLGGEKNMERRLRNKVCMYLANLVGRNMERRARNKVCMYLDPFPNPL